MQWLRRSFIAGFFVTVPLFISVAAFIWLFRLVDGFVGPSTTRAARPRDAGLGIADDGAGDHAGRCDRDQRGRQAAAAARRRLLLQVPLFRSIYAPVKQLVVAFSPDNEYGFKRVVLVEDAPRGFLLGFLTREFTVDRGQGPRRWWRSTCRPTTSTWATS